MAWIEEDLHRAMVTLARIAYEKSADPKAEARAVFDTLGNHTMRNNAERDAAGSDD